MTRNLPQGSDKMEHACVLHYIDRKKPWNFCSNDKFSKEYFEYLKLTDWKNFIKSYNLKVVPKSLLIRLARFIFEIRNLNENTKQIKILGLTFTKERKKHS